MVQKVVFSVLLKVSVRRGHVGAGFISVDESLKELYTEKVELHNKKIEASQYPDSGFDLFLPEAIEVDNFKKVDFKVKGKLISSEDKPMGYYLYPRSSISKTKLRLANSVGIIDSGYRGNLLCAFDNIGSDKEKIEKHNRLVQICSPDLQPLKVCIVDELDSTERGSGGFGSTGV